MLHHKGKKWYATHFDHLAPGLKLVDPTPSYFRSRLAAYRIYKDFPEAKIVICLRNPIERAFSHYWHDKKKFRFNYKFDEVLENYDLFKTWVEPGFYGLYLSNFLQYFPPKRILCQLFDNLKVDHYSFYKEVLTFINVDTTFIPPQINQKINAATSPQKPIFRQAKNVVRSQLKKFDLLEFTYRFMDMLRAFRSELIGSPNVQKLEKLSAQSDSVINELNLIFKPEIERLEDLLKINLDVWKYNKLSC